MDTFKKRQKEMLRQEKAREKAAKRLTKKKEKLDGPGGLIEWPEGTGPNASEEDSTTDDGTAAVQARVEE